MTWEPLVVLAVFALICVWWIGNIAVNLRKQNSELVDKLVEMADRASIRRLDRDLEPKLPDYIPFDPNGPVEGGFYKQADGSWVAHTGPQHIEDSPLGGKEVTTAETVDGIFPTVEEIELEEEA